MWRVSLHLSAVVLWLESVVSTSNAVHDSLKVASLPHHVSLFYARAIFKVSRCVSRFKESVICFMEYRAAHEREADFIEMFKGSDQYISGIACSHVLLFRNVPL